MYIEINGISYPNINATAILDPAYENGTLKTKTTTDSIDAVTGAVN